MEEERERERKEMREGKEEREGGGKERKERERGKEGGKEEMRKKEGGREGREGEKETTPPLPAFPSEGRSQHSNRIALAE
jgi:hypothetical protein